MDDVRPRDLRPSDLRPIYKGPSCSRPRLLPSDCLFFIAEDAVSELYEEGAMECRAFRERAFFFFASFFLAAMLPREDAPALKVEELSTANDCLRVDVLRGMLEPLTSEF